MAESCSKVRESTARRRASTENILGILKHVIEHDLLSPFVKKFHDLPPFDQKSDHVEIIVDDEQFCDIFKQLYQKLSSPGEDTVYPLDIQSELFRAVCDHEENVFQAFSRLADTCLRSQLLYQDSSPSLPILLTRILSDGCNCNSEFSVRLCQEGALLETITWTCNKLRDKHMKRKLNQTTETILKQCLTTVYKCSKEDANFETLKKVKTLDLAQSYFDSHSDEFQRIAILSAIYLTEEKHAKIFKATKKCRIRLIVDALRAALGEETCLYEGWRASELLKGIGRFALYDCNKKSVVDCGALDLMTKAMLVQDKPDVLQEAVTALWTITFDPLYKPVIRRDKNTNDVVTKVIAEGKDNPCYTTARGLMWSVRESLERTISESGGALPVMVSYHWSDKNLVEKVCGALKSWAEYNIWIDETNENGPSIDDMKTAIDQSLVVFVCLSRRFKNSLICRTGIEYACAIRKELVPILISPKYKPDGWLANLIGERHVFDVTDERSFDQKIREIIKILESKGM